MTRFARDMAYLVLGLVLGGAMSALAASGTIVRTSDGLQQVYRFTGHGNTDTKPNDAMRVVAGKWYTSRPSTSAGLQTSTAVATDEIQLWGWGVAQYAPQDFQVQMVRTTNLTVYDLHFRKQNSTQYYKLAFTGGAGAVNLYKCNAGCGASLASTTVDHTDVRVLVTGTGTPRVRVWMGTDTTADIDYTFGAGETWNTGTVSISGSAVTSSILLWAAIPTGTSLTVSGADNTKYVVLCDNTNAVLASAQSTGSPVALDVTTVRQPIQSTFANQVQPRIRIHNTSSCAGTADVAESAFETIWAGDLFTYTASSWLVMGPRLGEVRPTTAKLWVRASESQAYRIQYKLCSDPSYPDDFTTQTVGPTTLASGTNFAGTLQFTGLTANTCYTYRVKLGSTIETNGTGQFTTTPTDGTDGVVKIAFSNCISSDGRPFSIFNTVTSKGPALFFDLGDTPYADDDLFAWAVTVNTHPTSLYYAKYDGILQEPNFNTFMRNTPMMTTWDDHDQGVNGDSDGNATSSLFSSASSAFDAYKGTNNPTSPTAPGKNFSYRYGNAEFVMLDTRTFMDRSEYTDAETLVTTGTVTATNGSTKIVCSQADCGWGAGASEVVVSSFEDGGTYTVSDAAVVARVETSCGDQGSGYARFYCATQGDKVVSLSKTPGVGWSGWLEHDIADADYSAKTAMVVDLYGATNITNHVIYFDSTGANLTNYYATTVTGLHLGWNRVEVALSAFTSTGSPTWSTITKVRVETNASFNATTYVDTLRVTDTGLWTDTPILIDGRYYQIDQVDKPTGGTNCSGETNDCAILQTTFQGSTASGKSYTAIKRNKTRLGWDQFVWAVNALKDSTARAKIVLSSTAFRFTTNLDTWGHYNSRSVGYQLERNRLFDWCKDQVTNNCAFLSGDSHVGFLAKHTDRDTNGQYEFQASGLIQPSWPSVASINAAGAAAYTHADLLEKNAGRPQFGLVTITTSGSCATTFTVSGCIQFQSFDINGKVGMDSANQRFLTRHVDSIITKHAHQQSQLLKHPLGNLIATFYNGTTGRICVSGPSGTFAAAPPCVTVTNAVTSGNNGPAGISMVYRDIAATDTDAVYTAYANSAGTIVYATRYDVLGGASPTITISGTEQTVFPSVADTARQHPQIVRSTDGYLWVCERYKVVSANTYDVNIKRSTNVDDLTAWGAAKNFIGTPQTTTMIPECMAGTTGEVLLTFAENSGGAIKSEFYDCTGQPCAWTASVTPITDFVGTTVNHYWPNTPNPTDGTLGGFVEFKPVLAHDGSGNLGLLYMASAEPYGCKFKRWDGTNWGTTITVQATEKCLSPSLAYVSGKWVAAYLSPRRQEVNVYRSDAAAPASFALHPELQPLGGFAKAKLQFNPYSATGRVDLSYVRLGSLNDSFDSGGSIVTDTVLIPSGASRVMNQWEFQEEFDKWLDSLKSLVR